MVGVENLIGNFDGLKNPSMFDGRRARLVKVDVHAGRERQWWICNAVFTKWEINVIIHTFRRSTSVDGSEC